jgi:hypothetical protein
MFGAGARAKDAEERQATFQRERLVGDRQRLTMEAPHTSQAPDSLLGDWRCSRQRKVHGLKRPISREHLGDAHKLAI